MDRSVLYSLKPHSLRTLLIWPFFEKQENGMVKGNGPVYLNSCFRFLSSHGENGLSSQFINLLEERRGLLGWGVSV